MNHLESQLDWQSYTEQELRDVVPLLNARGFTLDTEQKHIRGERYLMQAVTTESGRKLILTGADAGGARVIIKATRDSAGKKEIERERTCRTFLHDIDFAGEVFHTPEELLYFNEDDFTVSIQKFIDQPCGFLERPVTEQFTLALRAFKGQESAHATTAKHRRAVTHIYGMRDAESYLQNFVEFSSNIRRALGESHTVGSLLHDAEKLLRENERTIEQYCGFLTHTDFVPHNIRIAGDTIYLLDHSSLTFGNKYEGWARFLNFMTLYNPTLEEALITYVHKNRTPEESISLRMMQIYRLGEIIWYYVQTLEKSEGNLRTLNSARVVFWSEVLSYILQAENLPHKIIENYTHTRDLLRSDDEKKRQQGLH